ATQGSNSWRMSKRPRQRGASPAARNIASHSEIRWSRTWDGSRSSSKALRKLSRAGSSGEIVSLSRNIPPGTSTRAASRTNRRRLGDVMRRETRGDDLEARVRKREPCGVALFEAHVGQAALRGEPARLLEHRGREVERDHRRGALRERERGVSGAAADVEHALAP